MSETDHRRAGRHEETLPVSVVFEESGELQGETVNWSRKGVFDATSVASAWKIKQPFFSEPAGSGGLHSYVESAARLGVDLYRVIDRRTGAKTPFAKSGIPGTVGSAACALWQELAARLTDSRDFKVWPFEGDLDVLLRSSRVVLGEIYPRAAYATALLDGRIDERPRLFVAKGDQRIRQAVVASLQNVEWVRRLDVTIEALAEAGGQRGRLRRLRDRCRPVAVCPGTAPAVCIADRYPSGGRHSRDRQRES